MRWFEAAASASHEEAVANQPQVILKLLTDIHGLLEAGCFLQVGGEGVWMSGKAQKPLPKRVPWHFQHGWRPASVSCGVGAMADG